jgi:pyrimidine deaminase RibD-like protein
MYRFCSVSTREVGEYSDRLLVTVWIKNVCDKQDFKPGMTPKEFGEHVFWKDWRAPKLVYMQPSGSLPYNPSTAWSREDEESTGKLLEGLSSRFIQALVFDLERMAGSAHVELAKRGQADDDRRFALMAIEEAMTSVSEDERPHPKVGAVVVKNGLVLSKAHRGELPKSHAEYIALDDKLSDDLIAGATVYTTLEPCTSRNHPKIPCAQRLIDRKVARVVIGMLDPNPNICGRGDQLLSRVGIEVQWFPRDLRAQVEEMNREFIRAQIEKQLTPTPDTAATVPWASTTEELPLQKDDPRVYVEFDDTPGDSFRHSLSFVVCNRGGGVAHHVQVEPLRMTIGSADFEVVDTLAVDKCRSLVPDLKWGGKPLGVLQAHDIQNILLTEWNAGGVATPDFVVPMKINIQGLQWSTFRNRI